MRRAFAILIPTILLGIWSEVASGQQPVAPADSAGTPADTAAAALPGQVDVTPDSTAPPPPPPAPKGPVTAVSARALKLEGQIQFQVSSSSIDSVTTWDSDLRRIRLTALADVTDRLSGSLMMDFGLDRAIVQDAFLAFRTTPTSPLSFQIGQFKVPFNGIQMWSDKYGLFIERGARIRGFPNTGTSEFLQAQRFSDRGRGVMATYKPGRATFWLGGFLGNGQASDNNDGKEVAARFEYSVLKLPSKNSKPLILGAAAVTNGYYGFPRDTLRVVSGDSLRIDDPQYAMAFEGWLEYGKYLAPGLHVAGNFITGENPTIFTDASDNDVDFETFQGIEGWGEFLLPVSAAFLTGVAPAFRADRFDPNTDADDDSFFLWTPGLNLYFGSVARWQFNFDVLDPSADGKDTISGFRTQAQLLF
jgi:hypothetical protein